jgi:hypothetical protein
VIDVECLKPTIASPIAYKRCVMRDEVIVFVGAVRGLMTYLGSGRAPLKGTASQLGELSGHQSLVQTCMPAWVRTEEKDRG